MEQIRKTERAKEIYAQRKETIERVFADAKEKHAMRYTHHRGLAAVTRWVRLKYAAMNLKKLANWSWNNSFWSRFFLLFIQNYAKTPCFPFLKQGFFDRLRRDGCPCGLHNISERFLPGFFRAGARYSY